MSAPRSLLALDGSSRLATPPPPAPVAVIEAPELSDLGDGQQVIVWERSPRPRARAELERHRGRFAELRYVWVPDWATPDDDAARGMATRLARPLPPATSGATGTAVLLAAYEQPTSVPLAVAAITAQDPEARIVVCDDGSTPAFLDAVGAAVTGQHANACYVWQEDRGFRVAASRNNGLRLADAAEVVLLDGDMIPASDLLARHRAAHHALGADLSVVVGNRMTAGEAEFAAAGGGAATPASLRAHSVRSVVDEDTRTRVRDMEGCTHHPWRVGFTCNLSVRGPAAFLDEAMRSRFGGEDLDWCYRLWRAGAPFAVAMEAEAVHLGLKESYRANLEVGTHDELVLHAETLLYMVSRHAAEPFMRGMLDALKYYDLDDDGRWSIGADVHSLYDGAAAYLGWREAHEEEARRLAAW